MSELATLRPCRCPSDWVVCFKGDCFRGRAIRELQIKAAEEARRVLGNDWEGVSCSEAAPDLTGPMSRLPQNMSESTRVS